jgi:predicted site-specific integrase-resolvase
MYVTPKEASKYYNVSENSLRTWANTGKIKYSTTKGGHRRYLLESKQDIINQDTPVKDTERCKIIYTRVSSKKQQDDLVRQTDYLKTKYPDYTSVSDIGSGINFKRPGFKRILEGVFKGNIQTVVVAHRDRFTRFGYELFEWIFKQHGAEIVSDTESDNTEQEELSEDLMAIITVFTARYYGKRKYKNRTSKLL